MEKPTIRQKKLTEELNVQKDPLKMLLDTLKILFGRLSEMIWSSLPTLTPKRRWNSQQSETNGYKFGRFDYADQKRAIIFTFH